MRWLWTIRRSTGVEPEAEFTFQLYPAEWPHRGQLTSAPTGTGFLLAQKAPKGRQLSFTEQQLCAGHGGGRFTSLNRYSQQASEVGISQFYSGETEAQEVMLMAFSYLFELYDPGFPRMKGEEEVTSSSLRSELLSRTISYNIRRGAYSLLRAFSIRHLHSIKYSKYIKCE